MTDEDREEIRALISIPGGGWSFAQGDSEVLLVEYDEAPSPWIYAVQGRLVDERPTLTGFSIRQRDSDAPVPITRQALRAAPLVILHERLSRGLRAAWEGRVAEVTGLMRTIRPKEGKSRSADHYRQVAWFHLDAQRTGTAPRKAISRHWGVSLVTASRWLAEARKRGYLPAYEPARTRGQAAPGSRAEIDQQLEARIFVKVLIKLARDTTNVDLSAPAAKLLAALADGEHQPT